jgi:glucosamine--fructose-6-phosphate aminotransferase (isomerizing)
MRKYAYDDQLASIPRVVEDVLASTCAPELDPDKPLIFTGIGTSLHAARTATEWVCLLSGGTKRAFAVDAHDIGTGFWPVTPADQVVAISHRGRKLFPTAAQEAALKAGASRVIAVVGKAAPDQPAHVTVRTCDNETAGTFSVSYLATLTALAKIVVAFVPAQSASFAAGLDALPPLLSRSLTQLPDAGLVREIAKAHPLLISGFGQDFTTAQEAALKIKEGAWLWTEGMSPEFALHGTPASYHPGMSAIVIMPSADDRERSILLRETLIGLRLACVATCGVEGSGVDLSFPVPPHPHLRPFLSIMPFHLLTVELARVRNTDPDTLHGHREPWKMLMTGLRL